MPYGIPGKEVFRRVLMMLKPEAFEAAFNAWIARLRDEAVAETGVDRPIISLDGKTARRSHDASEGLGPLHVVTAWAGEYGLALGLEVCAEKSNEITAIPALLRKIDIRGGIVTTDAMGPRRRLPGR
ncbi:MAG TPA: ISAs1 family transposase [Isosphaeraceae bacterium]